MPIGQYEIEVIGNAEFQSATKVINLINEEDRDVVQVFVGLRRRQDTDIEFLFKDGQDSMVDCKKVDAKAILIPALDGSREALD